MRSKKEELCLQGLSEAVKMSLSSNNDFSTEYGCYRSDAVVSTVCMLPLRYLCLAWRRSSPQEMTFNCSTCSHFSAFSKAEQSRFNGNVLLNKMHSMTIKQPHAAWTMHKTRRGMVIWRVVCPEWKPTNSRHTEMHIIRMIAERATIYTKSGDLERCRMLLSRERRADMANTDVERTVSEGNHVNKGLGGNNRPAHPKTVNATACESSMKYKRRSCIHWRCWCELNPPIMKRRMASPADE